MKYFSMFSGIGGFELGIGEAHDCVGYSEVDKYAIQIYEKHFKHKNYGDATKINTAELPDFDLLVGGFPCQAFSIAGKRKGFDDSRGTLFYEIARVLRDKRPRHFLLENVKGLLSHDKGKTFQTILEVLSDLGYDVEWRVLNSKNFGVPQNRERVFIVGCLRGERRQQVLPFARKNKQDGNKSKKEQEGRAWVSTLDSRYGQRWSSETYVLQHAVISLNDGSEIVLPRIRRLTPIECERLQGFPDNWTEGVSDTQRYKCLGNAVTVNVVREIIKQMI